MTRWRAATLHLAASAVAGALVLALVLGIWYPGRLFQAAGGAYLTALMLGGALAAGPLLTVIVFKSGKRGMAFDMAFIAVCQVAAMAWGLYVIAIARPAFLVFAVDRIVVVAANQLDDADLAAAAPAFRQRPWTGPVLVAAVVPEDTQRRNALLESALGGKDIDRYPQYYAPYADHAAAAMAAAQPLVRLRVRSPAAGAAVERFLAGRDDGEDLGFLPLMARRDMAAVISERDGAYVGIVPINPWQ